MFTSCETAMGHNDINFEKKNNLQQLELDVEPVPAVVFPPVHCVQVVSASVTL